MGKEKKSSKQEPSLLGRRSSKSYDEDVDDDDDDDDDEEDHRKKSSKKDHKKKKKKKSSKKHTKKKSSSRDVDDESSSESYEQEEEKKTTTPSSSSSPEPKSPPRSTRSRTKSPMRSPRSPTRQQKQQQHQSRSHPSPKKSPVRQQQQQQQQPQQSHSSRSRTKSPVRQQQRQQRHRAQSPTKKSSTTATRTSRSKSPSRSMVAASPQSATIGGIRPPFASNSTLTSSNSNNTTSTTTTTPSPAVPPQKNPINGRYMFVHRGNTIYEWKQSLNTVWIYVTPPPRKEHLIKCQISKMRLQIGLSDAKGWFIDEETFGVVTNIAAAPASGVPPGNSGPEQQLPKSPLSPTVSETSSSSDLWMMSSPSSSSASMVPVSSSSWSIQDDVYKGNGSSNNKVICIILCKASPGELWEMALTGGRAQGASLDSTAKAQMQQDMLLVEERELLKRKRAMIVQRKINKKKKTRSNSQSGSASSGGEDYSSDPSDNDDDDEDDEESLNEQQKVLRQLLREEEQQRQVAAKEARRQQQIEQQKVQRRQQEARRVQAIADAARKKKQILAKLTREEPIPTPEQQQAIIEKAHEYLAADIRLFSSCEDDQQANDNSNVHKTVGLRMSKRSLKVKSNFGGVCTSVLLNILYEQHGYTERTEDDPEVIAAHKKHKQHGSDRHIKDKINKHKNDVLTYAGVLFNMRKSLKSHGYQQAPVLTASRPISMKDEFYIIPPKDKFSGSRKALIIGINYHKDSSFYIPGCQNDAWNMIKYLKDCEGFVDDDIVILMDDDEGENKPPTKENILKAFHRFAFSVRPGDAAFFFFAGHGKSSVNTGMNDDESAEFDQVMLPMDFEEKGGIVDDEIFRVLLIPLRRGVQVTAVVDCCHSGSIFDLPFEFLGKEEKTKGGEIEEEEIDYRTVKFPHMALVRHERDRLKAIRGMAGQRRSVIEKVMVQAPIKKKNHRTTDQLIDKEVENAKYMHFAAVDEPLDPEEVKKKEERENLAIGCCLLFLNPIRLCRVLFS